MSKRHPQADIQEAMAWANSPEGQAAFRDMEDRLKPEGLKAGRSYYLPEAQRLLTFPDGQKMMFRSNTATLIAANDPRPLGLPLGNWTHNYTPRLLYKTPGKRYVSRVFQGTGDDRMEAVDLEEATRLFEALGFQGTTFDAAFDSQFPDA